jgi:hypothetical protein
MIQNKLQKFLIGLTSLSVLAVVVMGIKAQEDAKKVEKVKNDLAGSANQISQILSQQQGMLASRQATLDKISGGPAPDITQNTTVKTVVPGKTVTQAVPVTTKTTKSS